MDGILVIDKPADFTSHDVVARVRRLTHERRIGHSGTLDPFATGVLVVLVGKATRLSQFLTGVDKEYEAIIRLGYATDTGDRTGRRLGSQVELESSRNALWSEDELELAMNSLRGFIDQVPPMFSAKKQKGEKLYELARRGEVVDRKPVRVCIHEFAAIKPGGVLVKDNLDGTYDFEVRIVCSSGTYIRTLAEDFGRRLGIGAHLAELRRTRVGHLTLAESMSLEQVKAHLDEEGVGTLLVDPNAALSWLPFVHLSAEDERRVRHGMEISSRGENLADGDQVRLCDVHGNLLAIGKFETSTRSLHPRVVLTEEVKAARS